MRPGLTRLGFNATLVILLFVLSYGCQVGKDTLRSGHGSACYPTFHSRASGRLEEERPARDVA